MSKAHTVYPSQLVECHLVSRLVQNTMVLHSHTLCVFYFMSVQCWQYVAIGRDWHFMHQRGFSNCDACLIVAHSLVTEVLPLSSRLFPSGSLCYWFSVWCVIQNLILLLMRLPILSGCSTVTQASDIVAAILQRV